MKKSIYIVSAIFALTVSSLFITSCDIKNPTEGLMVIANTIARQTTVVVNISDPEGPNISSPITVKFAGPDSAKVIDEVNKKITMRSTTDGNFTFSIKDGTAISGASPVRLVLQCRAKNNDYLDVDCPVVINSTGSQSVYLKMIKKTALKDAGIEQVSTPTTGTTNSNTGAVVTPVTVSTPSGTQVTIPTGSVLKDASGNPLTGQINVSVTTYSQRAVNLLPSHNVTINNNSMRSAMSFEVQVTDQNGRYAASLGNTNTQVTLPLGSTVNPSTGTSFQAGDEADFYFIDANGNPHSLGHVTVAAAAAASFMYKSTISFLAEASVTLDFSKITDPSIRNALAGNCQIFFATAVKNLRSCTFTFPGYTPGMNLELRITYNFGPGALVDEVSPITGQTLTVPILASLPGTKAAAVIKGTPMAASASLDLGSGAGPYSLPITLPGLKYFDIRVVARKPGDLNQHVNPDQIPVNITKNGVSYGSVTLVQGRAGIYLEDNSSYHLSADYKGKHEADVTVANGNVSFNSGPEITPMPDAGPYKIYYYIDSQELF